MDLEQIFIDLSRKQFEADEEFETKLSTRLSQSDQYLLRSFWYWFFLSRECIAMINKNTK
jgi:hypothetical protein